MEDLKRVYVTQDDDCHWYVIPYDLKDEFNNRLGAISKLAFLDGEELTEEFEKRFGQYATGGDINLIELYARI